MSGTRERTAAPLIGFRRHLRPEVVSGEATYLFSEQGVTAVQGAQLEAIAPLLDGTRDFPTLVRQAPPGLSTEQLGSLMDRLADAGLIGPRPPAASGSDEPALAYWDAAGLDGPGAVARTASGRIRLITAGEVDSRGFREALGSAGLQVLDTAAPAAGPRGAADLAVVLCDDYLAPELSGIDAAQRAAGIPWLLARPCGAQIWIGPVFVPGEGACWDCLAHRLRGHRRAEAHVQSALGRSGPAARPLVSLPPLGPLSSHLVVLEAVKWLAGYRHQDQQSVWTLDTLTTRSRHHEVRARPQCPSCGDPSLVAARVSRPVRISSRPKACYEGGGHRSQPPEALLAQYRHLISPVTGVVKEIRRDPRGPAFLNSFLAGSNVAASAASLGALRAGLRSENGGKGGTALHARVSALCEALERHCGYFQGDEPRIRGSLHSLGDRAVHPDRCLLFHQRQYADRARWNAQHSAFQYIGEPFDEHAEIDWTPVWSLTEERHRLLPTGMLYFGAPEPPGPRFFRADSNGNAAGSSIEDAVLQGFLELVERDAVALWWYNRTRHPAMDLDRFGTPWIDELRTVHAGLHREVWALDITADLGIPTVVALSRRTDKPAEDIVFGFGAHFDPRLALHRALTEVNQLLPAVLGAGPGGGYTVRDPEALRWWQRATVANQPYLGPDPATPPRRPGDFSYTPRQDLRDDIAAVRRLVAEHGMELLVLDQTRPDIGLPVVKVIVPGLRHFWSRFAPGRLYDVPVQLGRLSEPTPYEELNPIPLFV